MDDIDVPHYFLCPISLQIMQDPVTTVTGITYDRDSIQQWLATAASDHVCVCPVTKQPLPPDSGLTPNHMLRRLIQAWCITSGIDRIPTPKSPLQRSLLLKLIRDVNRRGGGDHDPSAQIIALKKLDELAAEDEKNHRCMAEAGVPRAMVSFVVRCFKQGKVWGLEEALRILKLTWILNFELELQLELELIKSVMWILKFELELSSITNALVILKKAMEAASTCLMENLNVEFFEEMLKILKRRGSVSSQAVRAAVQVLIQACPWGRNRTMIVEAGAVFELIEMELSNQEKKTTELSFCLLAQLCSCADGRQQLLKHAGGMAVVAKRLLRNSAATDDGAVCVMESIARFSATKEVVMEMLRVGAVAKLCMVMQADCADYLKKKAREILRLHSGYWSNSPCIQVYLLTRNPR